MNIIRPGFSGKHLAMKAMRASVTARKVAGVDYTSPVDVYDACEKHGVGVRFNDINMEGMYVRAPRPRIHISALRPLARRNLTCAHELGHHVFGHGSTVDELREKSDVADHNDPNEFMANQFAYFFMMPAIGIRNALTKRGININAATDEQLFSISSSFKVGYVTLLTHMRYGLEILPELRFKELRRITPKDLRSRILSQETNESLVLIDEHCTSPTVDLETGDYLSLPCKLAEAPTQMKYVKAASQAHIYQAVRPGIGQLVFSEQNPGKFVRVAQKSTVDGKPAGYIGLAKYRHMEEEDAE